MMKKTVLAFCLFLVSFVPVAQARTADRPNVIVILADDMGIDSVSAFNDKLGMKTPAIEIGNAQARC